MEISSISGKAERANGWASQSGAVAAWAWGVIVAVVLVIGVVTYLFAFEFPNRAKADGLRILVESALSQGDLSSAEDWLEKLEAHRGDHGAQLRAQLDTQRLARKARAQAAEAGELRERALRLLEREPLLVPGGDSSDQPQTDINIVWRQAELALQAQVWAEALESLNETSRLSRNILARVALREEVDLGVSEAKQLTEELGQRVDTLRERLPEDHAPEVITDELDRWGAIREQVEDQLTEVREAREASEFERAKGLLESTQQSLATYFNQLEWATAFLDWTDQLEELRNSPMVAFAPNHFRQAFDRGNEAMGKSADPVAGLNAFDQAVELLEQAREEAMERGRLELGDAFQVVFGEEHEITMAWIEPGVFVMGSSAEEWGHRPDESPQTEVAITQGFWISTTPVTVSDFESFVNATGYRTEAERDRRRGVMIFGSDGWEDDNEETWLSLSDGERERPVVGVSWNDAVAFTNWLNERESYRLPEGYQFSLPSEAQWEFAARGGTTTPWWFGDDRDQLPEYGWYRGNSEGRPRPVSEFPANPFGLYDVHGNVYEWTSSRFRIYPGRAVEDYRGAISGAERVLRGGSWINAAGNTRSAHRVWFPVHYRGYAHGFRIALVPVQAIDAFRGR